jgi:hypothetical protein
MDMSAPEEGREVPEMVSFAEIARRVSERGLTRPITRQGVRHIAETDPAWPVPKERWQKIGNALVMPWAPVEKFFRDRKTRGRGPDVGPRQRSDGAGR